LRSGKKDREALPLLYHLAKHGWVCISANYRLQPRVRFGEQVDDIRQVVAWAKVHAAEYGGDPDFVMIGGGSSGGHLAAMIGLEAGSVDAVVAFYGQFHYGPSEESPSTYVTENAPPFFLLHGDHDNLVPVEGTRQFAQALRSVSRNPVIYAELPNATHNFDLFNSVRSLTIARAVEIYGAWARKSKKGVIGTHHRSAA
jgi:acetyl esterase/lipase